MGKGWFEDRLKRLRFVSAAIGSTSPFRSASLPAIIPRECNSQTGVRRGLAQSRCPGGCLLFAVCLFCFVVLFFNGSKQYNR